MREVARRYPDDPDAGALFAESMMDLNPWHLWSNDGKPAPGTEEIVAALERVLRRSPDHVGANHFYIHALEASPYPERALPSAKRLENMVPAAGHLVHMPSHIYENTGFFHLAVVANEQAVAADRAFLATAPPGGMYGAMYFGHNLHFLAFAAMMEGNYAQGERCDGATRRGGAAGAGNGTDGRSRSCRGRRSWRCDSRAGRNPEDACAGCEVGDVDVHLALRRRIGVRGDASARSRAG